MLGLTGMKSTRQLRVILVMGSCYKAEVTEHLVRGSVLGDIVVACVEDDRAGMVGCQDTRARLSLMTEPPNPTLT